MKCLTDEDMTACLVGEMTPEERLRLDAHTDTCLKCRDAMDSLSRDLEILALLPQAEASPDFESDVWMRLYKDLAYLTRLGRLLTPVAVSPSPRRRIMKEAARETSPGPASTGRG